MDLDEEPVEGFVQVHQPAGDPEVVGREDEQYPVPAKSGRCHAPSPPGCD